MGAPQQESDRLGGLVGDALRGQGGIRPTSDGLLDGVYDRARARTRWRRGGLAVVVCAISVIGVVAITELVASRPRPPGHAASGDAPAPNGPVVLYDIPVYGKSSTAAIDGTMYRQQGASAATAVGQCVGTQLGTTAFGRPQVVCSSGGNSFVVDDPAAAMMRYDLPPGVDTAFLSRNGVEFTADGQIMQLDTSTNQIATQGSVPQLSPDPSAGALPSGYKGLPPVAQISGYVQADSGHVLATLESGLAAALYDTATGQVQPIKGYGAIEGPAVAADGSIYAFGWRTYDQTFTIKVLRIDPSSLAVTATFDTGINPKNSISRQILSTATHGMIGLITEDRDGNQIDHLRQFTDSGSVTELPSALINAGIFASVGTDDLIYLFGGKAKSKISTYNLDTSAVSQALGSFGVPSEAYVVFAVG